MTDKGVGALAAALHQSTPDLEELDLGGNELTSKARAGAHNPACHSFRQPR